MRLAFVVRLGNDTRPAAGLFEGWIEEVDSGTEIRFRSTEELLRFLARRFDLAMAGTGTARAGDADYIPSKNKSFRKGKNSP